jgi:predicted metal-dependent hydrolase
MTIERQLAALQKHLKTLKTQADRAQGQARRRMKRLERRTRVQLERAMRRAEPRVREAVAQAALLSRSFRVGVRAGAAAYRASRAPKR